MYLNRESILDHLEAESLFAPHLILQEEADSTNTRLKQLAEEGMPEGTVVVTGRQTGGRGTHGRSFFSPEGGLYLSVLLRPRVPLAELLTLTGWAAVAVRRGIQAACGAPAEIKWLNDIYLDGRKLCGILTELAPLRPDGTADYVVVGIGVNVSQTAEDFRTAGLEDIAVSLAMAGYEVNRERLCACILCALEEMYRSFPGEKAACLQEYQVHCLSTGRRVRVEAGTIWTGTARGIGEDFSLLVEDSEGVCRPVSSGTVTLL